MFELVFEVNGKKITKIAHNKGEVRRLVYLYGRGDLEKMVKEVLEQEITNEFKNKKDGGNL